MPKKIHHVKLTPEERTALEALTRKGEVQVRVYKRARILLLADAGFKDAEIMTRTGSSRATVTRIRERYGYEGRTERLPRSPVRVGPASLMARREPSLPHSRVVAHPRDGLIGTYGCWRIKR